MSIPRDLECVIFPWCYYVYDDYDDDHDYCAMLIFCTFPTDITTLRVTTSAHNFIRIHFT